MKLRNVVLVAGLLAAALGSALYEAKLYLEKKKEISDLVVRAVSPYINGSFRTGSVRFGFFSAHLTDCGLFLPAQAISITVDEIRVGISPLKLLRTSFSIPRSIDEIALVGPVIELLLTDSSTVVPPRAHAAWLADASASMRNRKGLAVGCLLVKNGRMVLKDPAGRVRAAGEDLEGRMWDTGDGLTYSLTGKFGAERKNLFINGHFSWRGERHRLSLRLNGAEIRHALAFGAVTITSGALNGALDVSFPDTVSMSNIESRGRIRIDHGTCRFAGMPKPFDSVSMALSIDGTRCFFDSLSARYSCLRLRAAGTWDAADAGQSDSITLECRDVRIDSLGIEIPSDAGRLIDGNGWLKGTLTRHKGSDISLSLTGGGVAVNGLPLLSLRAAVTFQNNLLSVDSIACTLPAGSLSASGTIAYGKGPPVYEFQCRGIFDSLDRFQRDLAGNVHCSGTVNGIGPELSGSFSVLGTDISCSGIPLGDVTATIQTKDDRVAFRIRKETGLNPVTASGIIRGVLSTHPVAACTLTADIRHAKELSGGALARLPLPDATRLRCIVGGWSDAFSGRLMADIHSEKMNGMLDVAFDRAPGPALLVVWKVNERNFSLGAATIAFTGGGRLFPGFLMIDSLVIPGKAAASGKVSLTAHPFLQAVCTYDIPVKELLEFFAHETNPAVEGGRIAGTVRFSGPLDTIQSRAEMHVRDLSVGGVGRLETDAILTASGGSFRVLPMVLRKDKTIVAAIDTIVNDPYLRLSGCVDELNLHAILGAVMPEEVDIDGAISGEFHSHEKGFPILVNFSSRKISANGWDFDSVRVEGGIDTTGVRINVLHATDGPRITVTAHGFIPWSLIKGDDDDETRPLLADVTVRGDIIATLHRYCTPAIDGTGIGVITLSFAGQPGNWNVREASLAISNGTLRAGPFLPEEIKNFSCTMSLKDSSIVATAISAGIGKRQVRLFSSHAIPEGYEPITIGPLDFGIFHITTPQRGLDIHLPGLMEKGETGELEPVGKPPFGYFSMCGPTSQLHVIGGILLRDVEFTYPPLKDRANEDSGAPSASSSGPLSRVTWDLDLKAADRRVRYFRDITSNATRFMRFFEANIDQGSSVLHINGSQNDGTLKFTGILRSYHGTVFYGKTFDRNFEAGLEFLPQKKEYGQGFNNLPILWGNAEAFSDSGRFDRIKLTALIQDPKSGALSERGRLTPDRFNVIFHLSSDFEELPGESERAFYRQAGLQFTTLGSAGKIMSDFGEQYLHRYFLQRLERKLAKSIGLDVINVETSIASNYFNRFYYRQFENTLTQADYIALANVGITVGRYFFRDNLFIKARGGLLPVDTALMPEYSLGLEFQPSHYVFMDLDYGFYRREMVIEHNPRVNVQLRLPITGLRNFFDF